MFPHALGFAKRASAFPIPALSENASNKHALGSHANLSWLCIDATERHQDSRGQGGSLDKNTCGTSQASDMRIDDHRRAKGGAQACPLHTALSSVLRLCVTLRVHALVKVCACSLTRAVSMDWQLGWVGSFLSLVFLVFVARVVD